MESIEVTGIVLNAMPYKEKDKLIHIFSVELGNITAILKGVNGSNAKLKFAGQQFCFAKFELMFSRDFYIVKGVDLIDSFFDVTIDYDNYSYCQSMLELSNQILKPNIISENLFLTILKTLENIVYNGINVELSMLKFYLQFLKIIGYALDFETCDLCGMKFVGDIKFDNESGTFRCGICSGGVIVNKKIFSMLKIIDNTDISRLNTLKFDKSSMVDCIRLLLLNISNKINYKIKSIDINNL